LYRAISAHPRLRMTTFSETLARNRPAVTLEHLVAGSWVFGTFSTWIGDPDKNRAWDLLVRAKGAFDAAVRSGRLSGDELVRAEAQLKVCEGSDWFWWFGDYNPAQTVSDFDRLFRDHLRDLYTLIGVAPPSDIDVVIGVGTGAPARGGAMRENPAS
jgi:alpha-amylase/alpha-mannosidase (GH57 family)